MRLLLVLVAAAGVFSAEARSQDALKACQVIKDDGERLKCYDGIAAAAGSRSAESGQKPEWRISDNKSPLDDSPHITALMPGSTDRSGLMVRCKDRKTEVAIVPESFIQCGGDPVRVIYRIDQGKPVEANWLPSSSCGGALAPDPIPFIRALTENGKLFFRIVDRRGVPRDAVFELGAVSGVRSKVAEACLWDAGRKP